MAKKENGEGCISKDNKTKKWIAKYPVGWYPNGEVKYKKKTGLKSEREAKKALEELKFASKTGTLTVDNSVKAGEYIELFIKKKTVLKAWSVNTIEKNKLFLKKLNEYPAFQGRLQALTYQKLQSVFDDLATEKNGVRTASSTLTNMRVLLRQAFNEAIKAEIIKKNPADELEICKDRRKPVIGLEDYEVEKILEAVKGHRLHFVVLLLLQTGIRRGELIGLQWDDIDFDKRMLNIRRSVVEIRGKAYVKDTKNKSSERGIPLTATMLELLKLERKKAVSEWVVVPEKYGKDDRKGLFMRPGNFAIFYRRICKKAGVSNTRVHSLRHTYANTVIEELGIKATQEYMGHSDSKMLTEIYLNVTEQQKNKNMKKLETVFEKFDGGRTQIVPKTVENRIFKNIAGLKRQSQSHSLRIITGRKM